MALSELLRANEPKLKNPSVTRRDRWGILKFQIKARATRPIAESSQNTISVATTRNPNTA